MSSELNYRSTAGMNYFNATNNAYMEDGYDMRVHQEPTHSVAHCSDSRQKAEMAIGGVALGKALELVNPGGFLTDPEGNITSDAGRWLDLTSAYGVSKAAIVQHSGCGQMNVLYTYHMTEGGAETVKKEKGEFFAKDASLRGNLIEEVKKNGFDFYEKMGIPLTGDDASKFQQAMAIQQLLWDMSAVEKIRSEMPKLPELEGQFQHIVEGRIFKLETLSPAKFVEVTAENSGCGCSGCSCS